MPTYEMTSEDYFIENEANTGYCPDCNELTGDCVEPDAEHYACHVCGGQKLMGLENALIAGFIEITD